MRIATQLRISPAVWLAPALVLLGLYYLDSNVTRGAQEPYPIALGARAIALLGLIAPVCAALGAWEAGRLQRAGWWHLPLARSRLRAAVQLLRPVVLAGVAAMGIGIVWATWSAGVSLPDPRPIAVAVAVVIAHAWAGFAVGVVLPPTIAVACAMFASLLWLVLPRALDPSWLRLLNGLTVELCCGRDTDLAPGAVVAPLMIAVAVIAVAGLVVHWASVGRQVLGISALVFAVAVAESAAVVTSLSGDPAVARDPAALRCITSPGGMTVCVWPEHAPRLDEVASVVDDAAAAWRDVGLAVPTVVSEGRQTPADGLRIGFSRRSSTADIVNSLASGLLPSWPPCADTERYAGGDAAPYLEAWLMATAGTSRDELVARFGDDPGLPNGVPPVLDLVSMVLRAPEIQQEEWASRNIRAMKACGIEPELRMTG